MEREELKQRISEIIPTATYEEGGQWLNASIEATDLPTFASRLRKDPLMIFDYLFCLTCVDWKTHLTMVYHLTSIEFRHVLVLKIRLDRNKPEIETVSNIWRTAEFHEREVYELFGVRFIHHPDLRLLILPDGWEGRNPLRKDFEDPINMIRL